MFGWRTFCCSARRTGNPLQADTNLVPEPTRKPTHKGERGDEYYLMGH